jgi:tetratricopeptide (TPR) repeat protein
VERANIDPQYVLGLCYADVKRYDDARHAFAAQYGFEPDSAEAYLLAARLFLRREFVAEAAVQAHKALEINPLCLSPTSFWEKWHWPRAILPAPFRNSRPNAKSTPSMASV